MILSGKEIQKRLGTDIIIEPFNEKQINPNSYNLRLHNELLVYEDRTIVDRKKEKKTKRIMIPEDGLVLEPGELYLGRTCEHTETLNGLVPMLEGRSSIARLGMFVHVTSGFGDVSFANYWTLEICVVRPIKIYPLVEVCQIYYQELKGEYEHYTGKYQKTNSIDSSMLYKDFIK